MSHRGSGCYKTGHFLVRSHQQNLKRISQQQPGDLCFIACASAEARSQMSNTGTIFKGLKTTENTNLITQPPSTLFSRLVYISRKKNTF